LYDDLGVELLDHSFEGFNTCIFACELPFSQCSSEADSQMARPAGEFFNTYANAQLNVCEVGKVVS
jgi:hypothetical protein